MTFSEQIVYAMFKPSKYKDLLNLKTKRSTLFIVVLMVVLGIVTVIIPTGALITGFGGFEKLFTEKMSLIEYKNGSLVIEKPFEMTFDSTNILIDTSKESITNDMLDKDGVYMAVGSEELRLVSSNGSQVIEYTTFKLDSMLYEGFNNAALCKYIPAIYGYLFLTFLITCVGYFIKYGFIALIFTIWINAINKQFQLNLAYSQVFMLCFYGQTLGIILSNFNAALGLFPQVIVSMVGIFISINFITTSIMLMRGKNQL